MKGLILVLATLTAAVLCGDCTKEDLLKFGQFVNAMITDKDAHAEITKTIRSELNKFYSAEHYRHYSPADNDPKARDFFAEVGPQILEGPHQILKSFEIPPSAKGMTKTDFAISHEFFAEFSWPKIKHCFVDIKQKLNKNEKVANVKNLDDLVYFMDKIKEHRQNVIFTSLAYTACGIPLADSLDNFQGMEIMNSIEFRIIPKGMDRLEAAQKQLENEEISNKGDLADYTKKESDLQAAMEQETIMHHKYAVTLQKRNLEKSSRDIQRRELEAIIEEKKEIKKKASKEELNEESLMEGPEKAALELLKQQTVEVLEDFDSQLTAIQSGIDTAKKGVDTAQSKFDEIRSRFGPKKAMIERLRAEVGRKGRYVSFKKFSFDVSQVDCSVVPIRNYEADKERKITVNEPEPVVKSVYESQLNEIKKENIISISWDSFGSNDPTSDFDLSVNVKREESLDLKNPGSASKTDLLKSHLKDIITINSIVDVANDRVMESGWRSKAAQILKIEPENGSKKNRRLSNQGQPNKDIDLDGLTPLRLLEEVLDSNSYPEIVDGYQILFKDDTFAKKNGYISFLANVEFGLHTTANFIFIQSCFQKDSKDMNSKEKAIFELAPQDFCQKVMSLIGTRPEDLKHRIPELNFLKFDWDLIKKSITSYTKIYPRESLFSMTVWSQIKAIQKPLDLVRVEFEKISAVIGNRGANSKEPDKNSEEWLRKKALQETYQNLLDNDDTEKMWKTYVFDRKSSYHFFFSKIEADKGFNQYLEKKKNPNPEVDDMLFMQWRRQKFTECFRKDNQITAEEIRSGLLEEKQPDQIFYWRTMALISTCHFWAAEAYLTYGALMAFKEKKEVLNMRTHAESAVENMVMFLEHAAHALFDSEQNADTKQKYGYEGSLVEFDVSDKFKYILRCVESLRAKSKIPVSGRSWELWGSIIESSLSLARKQGFQVGYEIDKIYDVFKAVDMYNYNNIDYRLSARKESKKDLYKVALEGYRFGIFDIRYIGLIIHVFDNNWEAINAIPKDQRKNTPAQVIAKLKELEDTLGFAKPEYLDAELTNSEKLALYQKLTQDAAALEFVMKLATKTNKEIMKEFGLFYYYVRDVTTEAMTINYVEQQQGLFLKIAQKTTFTGQKDERFDASMFKYPPKPKQFEVLYPPQKIKESFLNQHTAREDYFKTGPGKLAKDEEPKLKMIRMERKKNIRSLELASEKTGVPRIVKRRKVL